MHLLGLVLIKFLKLINHQKLTLVNRLILNNFCIQPETPWKLQNSSTSLLYKQAVHQQSFQAFSQSRRQTHDVTFSGKREAPVLLPDMITLCLGLCSRQSICHRL